MISASFTRRSPFLALLLFVTASCVEVNGSPTGLADEAGGTDAQVPTPSCTDGHCPVILWSGGSASADVGLVVGADSVYWSNVLWDFAAQQYVEQGELAVPIAGGSMTRIAAKGYHGGNGSSPPGLLDPNHLYWPTFSGVVEFPLGGGKPTTINVGAIVLTGVALRGGDFFGVVADSDTDQTYVFRVPTSGGSPMTLATVPFSNADVRAHLGGGGVTRDAANVYWEETTEYEGEGAARCEDGGCLLLPASSMHVLSTPLAGGSVTTLASTAKNDVEQDTDLSMGVDESNVYFIDHGAIVSVPLTGGAETTVASSPKILDGFVFDGDNFYWTASSGSNGSTGIVAKVAKHGGPVTTVLSVDGAWMMECAVDGASVYAFYTMSGLVPLADPNAPAALVKITPK